MTAKVGECCVCQNQGNHLNLKEGGLLTDIGNQFFHLVRNLAWEFPESNCSTFSSNESHVVRSVRLEVKRRSPDQALKEHHVEIKTGKGGLIDKATFSLIVGRLQETCNHEMLRGRVDIVMAPFKQDSSGRHPSLGTHVAYCTFSLLSQC